MFFPLFLGLVIVCSVIGFFVGLLMLLSGHTRKKGLKVLVIALIAFLIGCGGCALFPIRI